MRLEALLPFPGLSLQREANHESISLPETPLWAMSGIFWSIRTLPTAKSEVYLTTAMGAGLELGCSPCGSSPLPLDFLCSQSPHPVAPGVPRLCPAPLPARAALGEVFSHTSGSQQAQKEKEIRACLSFPCTSKPRVYLQVLVGCGALRGRAQLCFTFCCLKIRALSSPAEISLPLRCP